MPVQIALLRGVNVGGHKKVEMARLRALLERLGQTDVRTYVQSGNVVFGGRRRTEEQLERAIEDEFGFPVAVQLRDLAAMRRLCESIPDDWTNDKEQKTDVGFLLDAPREKVWHALRKDLGPRYVVDWDGAEVTARNVNTVRKLTDLMRAL